MPCDIATHSHPWPTPEDVKTVYFTIKACETICGYCLVPGTSTGGRDRFSSADHLRRHVRGVHTDKDSETRKEIDQHAAVKRILGTLSYARAELLTVADPVTARVKLACLHDALYIRENRSEAFEALACKHLRKTIKTSPEPPVDVQRGSDEHHDFIDVVAKAFNDKYGPALWSQNPKYRKHLQTHSVIYESSWSVQNSFDQTEGPISTIHTNLTKPRRRKWYQKNPDQPITDEVNFVNSELGCVLREYFYTLQDAGVTGTGDEEQDDEQSEADMLKVLTSVDGSEQQQEPEPTTEEERDDQEKVEGEEESGYDSIIEEAVTEAELEADGEDLEQRIRDAFKDEDED